ncbi:hypothetical protein NADFUDRAFT_71410 [Nadsonia fulvescens var. elongata DSM 6958]|uniref:Maintenance of mitochondrial morphology protein 1 n=1 Tax=Nadsonia fulvescens var. elongata DSM 6958 TaxID=857566 RepID=A0A1E3PG89_9ASCO|nr:hypothetical protein NADFUDRAFT_71410 [Nadsonia fulvescens var. elongata DSM 6958]
MAENILNFEPSESSSTENLSRQVIIYSTTPWGFAHGLLFGQTIAIILLAIFFKFVVFVEAKPVKKASKRTRTPSFYDSETYLARPHFRPGSGGGADNANSNGTDASDRPRPATLRHAPESLSWFNVLLAQTLNQLRDDALRNDNLLNSLTAVLNSDSRPSFLDTINITELNLGDDFPIFSNCRIVARDDDNAAGGLEAKIDVDLTDTLTLGIETKLLVYYRNIIKANLPVSLSVSIVRFTATLNLSLMRVDSTPDDKPKTSLTFSLAPDYNLEFAVRSLVGSKSRLQNVPKIGDIIESRLRHWFVERCVEPKAQEIVLPSFFPRSKNTGTAE